MKVNFRLLYFLYENDSLDNNNSLKVTCKFSPKFRTLSLNDV